LNQSYPRHGRLLTISGTYDYSIPGTFQITPSGWIEALKATGVLCNEQMKKDLGSLCGALKNRLNGRHEPALVGTDEIVSTTGLPRYWIVNVIHSHLVKYCLKKIDADWADGDAMRCR
jgi:hypothetical protein